jgi:uroporphyrinogen-III decarboxylase
MYITDESYRQPLQAKLINSCKEAKIKTLQTYFNPQTQHLIEASEKLGFKCSVETKLFEKEI